MFSIARGSLRSALARSALTPSLSASVHTLPDLPYSYNALEPYISEEIMTLHHKKHHQTYVTGLNAAEEAYAKLSGDSTKDKIALQAALKFNGGGHINHSLFWKNLAPAAQEGGKIESGPLKTAIERDFGSVEEFKKTFNAKTAAIQGSGWGWLGYSSTLKKLEIVTHREPGPSHLYLLSSPHTPIIGVDIWEHYKNVKPDYLNAIWNVINFKEAEKRLVEVAK
ncbi:Mn superoxide dismutase [Mycena amicta]|nr:Mn superoxide dismutase [Mycena amicta]